MVVCHFTLISAPSFYFSFSGCFKNKVSGDRPGKEKATWDVGCRGYEKKRSEKFGVGGELVGNTSFFWWLYFSVSFC